MASADGSITVTQQEFAQLQSQLLSLRTENYQLTESENALSATVKRLRDELSAAVASAAAASSAADASSLYSSSLALLGLSSSPTTPSPPPAEPPPEPAAQPASTSLFGGLWGSSIDEEKEQLKKTIAQQSEEHRMQISVLTQSIRELFVRNSALQSQLDEATLPGTAQPSDDIASPVPIAGSPSRFSDNNIEDSSNNSSFFHSSSPVRSPSLGSPSTSPPSTSFFSPDGGDGDEPHELSEIDLSQEEPSGTLFGSPPTTPSVLLRSSAMIAASKAGKSPSSSCPTPSSAGTTTSLEQLIEDYQLELKAKSDQIAQHTKEKQLLKNELKITKQKVDNLTQQRNHDIDELESQKRRLAQQDMRIEELSEAHASSERRIRFLEGDSQQTQELVELTKITKDQLSQQVLALTSQVESLQGKHQASEDLLAASRLTITELADKALLAQTDIDQRAADFEATTAELRARNEELERQLVELQNAVPVDTPETAAALSEQLVRIGELEERIAKQQASHKFEVASLLEQIDAVNVKLVAAQAATGETAAELQRQLQETVEQLRAAEQEADALSQENLGLKEELCRTQEDHDSESGGFRDEISSLSAARDLYQKEVEELRTRLDDREREQAIEDRKNSRLIRELQQQLQKLSSSPPSSSSSPSSSPSSLPDVKSLQEETNNLLLRIGEMQEEKIQLQEEIRQLKQTNEKNNAQLRKFKSLSGNPSSPIKKLSRSPSGTSVLEEDEANQLLVKIGEIQQQNAKLQEDNARLRRMLAGGSEPRGQAKAKAMDIPTRGHTASTRSRGTSERRVESPTPTSASRPSSTFSSLFDMSR